MRNRFVFISAAALCYGACSFAVAADMPTKAYKAPITVAAYNWSGCYVGGFVGGASGSNVDATEPSSTGGVFAAGTFYCAPERTL